MPADAVSDPLPERYAVSGAYMALRACERFRIDPRPEEQRAGGWDGTDPGWRTLLLAYEDVRQAEEAQALGLMAAMGAARAWT